MQENLKKEFTDRLVKENICYRNFLVIATKGCPLGRYNRFVITRCVVNQIRLKYPELSEAMFTGFIDVQIDTAHSASTSVA